MQTGETKGAIAELGRPAGRHGWTASPTFLSTSQGDHFLGIRTVHGLRWRGGGEVSASGAESSGKQWGKGLNAWARGWLGSLEIRILAQLPQTVSPQANYFISLTLLSLSVKCQ